MGRKNHRGGRSQARRRQDGKTGRRVPPPPPLEHLVIPQGRCHFPHRKLKFTQDEAHAALRQARAKRERLGQAYSEERVYECRTDEGGCGSWHLTSRKSYHKRSAS